MLSSGRMSMDDNFRRWLACKHGIRRGRQEGQDHFNLLARYRGIVLHSEIEALQGFGPRLPIRPLEHGIGFAITYDLFLDSVPFECAAEPQ